VRRSDKLLAAADAAGVSNGNVYDTPTPSVCRCRFHEATGIPFSHMLFFDDEKRNVESVSTLGR